MSKQIEAMKQAIEWLEWFQKGDTMSAPATAPQVLCAIREALAEPAQPTADEYNRKLRQQLESEWVALAEIRRAEQPAHHTEHPLEMVAEPAQQFTEDAPADCKRLAEHGAPICGRCHMGPCKYTAPQAQSAPTEADLMRCWVEKPSGEIDGIASMKKVLEKFGSATQPAREPLTDEQREKLRDAFAQALTSVYVCGRVWDAWQYSTMSEDDFKPASECNELLDGLIEAAHGIGTKGNT